MVTWCYGRQFPSKQDLLWILRPFYLHREPERVGDPSSNHPPSPWVNRVRVPFLCPELQPRVLHWALQLQLRLLKRDGCPFVSSPKRRVEVGNWGTTPVRPPSTMSPTLHPAPLRTLVSLGVSSSTVRLGCRRLDFGGVRTVVVLHILYKCLVKVSRKRYWHQVVPIGINFFE